MNKTRFVKHCFIAAVAIAAGVLSFGPVWMTPLPDPVAAQRALAVFALCLALWLTHAIPLAITGMLAFTLLPLLQVGSEKAALAHLGNPAVFFMLGVFFLVAAMIATGLSKRLSLFVLGRFDGSPRSLFTGVVVASSFLAMWMPEHAVAAMMFPVVLEVVQALRLEPGRSRYAQLLFMGMAWGAVIGGVGTFLGGARAPLAISLLQEYSQAQAVPINVPDFLEWMIAALPVVVILTGVAVVLLPLMLPIDVTDVSRATRLIRERVAGLGPMTAPERRLALLSVATVACWIGLGHHAHVGPATIAAGSAAALFLLGIVSYRDIHDFINWNVLLMYGGAIAIGSALNDTGAIQWIVDGLGWRNLPPIAIAIVLATLAMVLTECISNAAAVVVLLPVGFSLCQSTGLDPVFVTLAVTIPAGLPFTLPVSAPPHAIAFSSGYYEPRDCLRPGLLMDVITLVVFIGVMLLYWPLLGFGV